jgi:tetratricopeptide (TPR) repeat protein
MPIVRISARSVIVGLRGSAIYHVTALSVVGALTLSVAACTVPATQRAMSLTRQHRETEAIATLRADLAKHPDDLEARKLLVRLLAFTGDFPAARAELDALTKLLPPNDPTPWIELGHAYELAHRFEEALAAYDTAASVAPSSPAGPLEGGLRCARWGEVDEARPRLEEAVRRGAHDAETYHTLGLVCLHQKDYAAAESAYDAGIAADPGAAACWIGLATVGVAEGDASKALRAYDGVLARQPTYAPAALGRAWALLKLGRNDEAKRAIDRAEQLGAPATNVAKARALLAAPTTPP